MNKSIYLLKRCGTIIMFLILFSQWAFAQRIDSLYIPDTRSIASMPANYTRSLKVNFKYNNVIGLSGLESYSTVIGLRGWLSDNSGGKAYELAFASGNIFLRSGYTAGWDGWKRILTDENIKELSNGNVGIGTTTPQSKLAVNGTVTAKQVTVIQSGWPDYVFDTAYRLPTLTGMEAFIKANHRLPGIQSAKQIEDKGLDLGDMQKKQMQKIEELTLYLIRQNKLIIQQQAAMNELNSEVKKLRKQVEQIKP